MRTCGQWTSSCPRPPRPQACLPSGSGAGCRANANAGTMLLDRTCCQALVTHIAEFLAARCGGLQPAHRGCCWSDGVMHTSAHKHAHTRTHAHTSDCPSGGGPAPAHAGVVAELHARVHAQQCALWQPRMPKPPPRCLHSWPRDPRSYTGAARTIHSIIQDVGPGESGSLWEIKPVADAQKGALTHAGQLALEVQTCVKAVIVLVTPGAWGLRGCRCLKAAALRTYANGEAACMRMCGGRRLLALLRRVACSTCGQASPHSAWACGQARGGGGGWGGGRCAVVAARLGNMHGRSA